MTLLSLIYLRVQFVVSVFGSRYMVGETFRPTERSLLLCSHGDLPKAPALSPVASQRDQGETAFPPPPAGTPLG